MSSAVTEQAVGDHAVTITLPDGSRRTFARGVTGHDVAAAIGPGLAKAAFADGGRRRAAGTSRARCRTAPRCA